MYYKHLMLLLLALGVILSLADMAAR